MKPRDLEYLIAVAEELHFGRAAERCNASQPALSGQLRKLEERLGVTLFERDKRNVRVTDIGARIVAQAQLVLQQVAEMEALAAAHRDPLAGRCRIGMPPTIGPYLTQYLLPAMKHYLPDVALELVEDFTDNLETQLCAGDLDIAVLATSPARSNLSEVVLYKEPFWIALPSGHPLARDEVIDIAGINPQELLLLADGHCLRDQIYAVCGLEKGVGGDPAGPRTQNTSLATILSLVGAGAGITLVPAMSLSGTFVTDAGIAVRPEGTGKAGRTVRLTFRSGYPRVALVEKLADIIASAVPNTVSPVRR